ncbi:MAG: hypothetical protein ACOCR6_00130 [archaeon]
MTGTTLLDSIRQPEYTGENRCFPCTVVNLGIVAVGSVVLARWSRLYAVLAVVVGIALVVLRGYVVPGTPSFAPKLVAPLPFDFGHTESAGGTHDERTTPDSLAAETDPERLLDALVDADVVEIADTALFLDDQFREAWNDRMGELRAIDDETFIERVTAASPEDVEGIIQRDRVILGGTRDVRTTRTVAIAETAAVEVLAEWGVPENLRAPAATPLRTFLRTCPSCDGPVSETTIRRSGCCGGPGTVYGEMEKPVLACEDCGSLVVVL